MTILHYTEAYFVASTVSEGCCSHQSMAEPLRPLQMNYECGALQHNRATMSGFP